MLKTSQPDTWSRHSVKIISKFNGMELGPASGVIVAFNNKNYLVTAGHVLTGRDEEGRCISSKAALPNEISITGGSFSRDYALYVGKDPCVDTPIFKRASSKAADIAVLEVTNIGYMQTPLHSTFVGPPSVYIKVGEKCIIVGYPKGIGTKGDLGLWSIWKAATIASEPLYADKDNPLLIDTFGEKGMSGSPVYYDPWDKIQGNRVIGIYVGRIDENSIGKVVPWEVVVDLLHAYTSEKST